MKKIIPLVLGVSLLLFSSCKSDDPTEALSQQASFDVIGVKVTNANGEAPKKGDELNIQITVKNTGTSEGSVSLRPKISSSRFSDFNKVSLDSVVKSLAASETAQVMLKTGPFINDKNLKKIYALGHGEYFLNSISINDLEDTDFEGGVFTIAKSNVVFVPVMYDPKYLGKVQNAAGIMSYLTSAFTRKVEVFDNGNYTEYPGGTDEMMGIKQLFYPVATINPTEFDIEGGKCEKATALATKTLGLNNAWQGPLGTQVSNHGFDYLIALSSESFGGVACSWINVQVTGVFDFDLSLERSQILLVHETAHVLGSPHCDPLQTYVMCSGEKHKKYIEQGIYVWNIASRNQMSNRFD